MSAKSTPISASAPPRGAPSNQPLQKSGFLREGAKPVSRNIRPPIPAKGPRQNLQRGLLGRCRTPLRQKRRPRSPSSSTLRHSSDIGSGSSLILTQYLSRDLATDSTRASPAGQRRPRTGVRYAISTLRAPSLNRGRVSTLKL